MTTIERLTRQLHQHLAQLPPDRRAEFLDELELRVVRGFAEDERLPEPARDLAVRRMRGAFAEGRAILEGSER